MLILNTLLDQTDIILYPGADTSLVQYFEKEMHLILPNDFKAFFSFCNGFESKEDMFRMMPLDEILESKSEYAPSEFFIAEYLIYSDMWQVNFDNSDTSKYQIFNINGDNQKLNLTNSLALFIQRFLQGGVFGKDGLYEWHEAVKATSK
jgi:hypothetical protein